MSLCNSPCCPETNSVESTKDCFYFVYKNKSKAKCLGKLKIEQRKKSCNCCKETRVEGEDDVEGVARGTA